MVTTAAEHPGNAKRCLVIPCFNEAGRLPAEELADLAEATRAHLIFVDDGSTDGTGDRLEVLTARLDGGAEILSLESNSGKGEAVRQGMVYASARAFTAIGYVDADMATPPDEVARLFSVLEDDGLRAALGSRVAILGHRIRRSPVRHYLGRVFATGASIVLALPVYDTQCGAKVFLAGPALSAALAKPFASAWAFDVELLGRLIAPLRPLPAGSASPIREVPLRAWMDRGRSKVRPHAMVVAFLSLAVIWWRLRRLKRAAAP